MPTPALFPIEDDTAPTLDEVLKALEEGKLEKQANTYALDDLVGQTFALTPIVWRYRKAFEEAGFGDPKEKIVTVMRLVTLTGHAAGDQAGLASEQRMHTKKQKEIRRMFVADRDAIVRLARDSGADSRLFSVNFGQAGSDAAKVLVPAKTFLRILEKHGEKISFEAAVKSIVERTKENIAALEKAEVEQEAKKKERLVPTGLKNDAKDALYRLLLHFSRTGFFVVRDDPDQSLLFSLTVLRGDAPSPVADDDDAPVVPAPVDGVEVPAGDVAGVG